MKPEHFLALVVSFVGCHAGPSSAGAEATSRQEGLWDVVFRQDDSLPVVRSREVRGIVALYTDHRLRQSLGLVYNAPGTTEGVAVVRFLPFGFEVTDTLGFTLARSNAVGDSIHVTLNAYVSHGGIEISAVPVGDSIVGRWYLNSSTRRGAGTVVFTPINLARPQ